MGIGGIWQWVVVLAIILLLFGTKKLRNIGSDMGHAVRGFKKGMAAEDKKPESLTDEGKEQPAATATEKVAEAETTTEKPTNKSEA